MLILQLIFSYLKSKKQLTLWGNTWGFFFEDIKFAVLIYCEQKLECPF